MLTKTKAMLRVDCRWLLRRDLPAVLAVERAGFPVPWTEGDFLAALRRKDVIGTAAERGGKVMGFVVYEVLRDRLHVLNLAVAPGARRVGVGAQLVNHLLGKLAVLRRGKVTAVVREHNDAAIRFWAACGFRATGVLRGYYGGKDAIRFRLDVPDPGPSW